MNDIIKKSENINRREFIKRMGVGVAAVTATACAENDALYIPSAGMLGEKWSLRIQYQTRRGAYR